MVKPRRNAQCLQKNNHHTPSSQPTIMAQRRVSLTEEPGEEPGEEQTRRPHPFLLHNVRPEGFATWTGSVRDFEIF